MTGYGYDLAGNLTNITYPGTSHTVSRGFDEAGRLTSTQDWLGNTTTFSYDLNGNQIGDTIPAPVATPLLDAYGYNDADQQTSTTVGTSAAPTSLANITYGRDDAGQLNAQPAGLSGTADTFSYNTLNRLTQKNTTNTWNYDTADNLTKIPDHVGFERAGVRQRQPALLRHAQHRILHFARQHLSYIADRRRNQTFGYDSRGNRTEVTPRGSPCPPRTPTIRATGSPA